MAAPSCLGQLGRRRDGARLAPRQLGIELGGQRLALLERLFEARDLGHQRVGGLALALGDADLLAEIDVLIDGPYIQALNDAVGLRGSSNQRVIQLTSRLKVDNLDSQSRNVEIKIADGELALRGPGVFFPRLVFFLFFLQFTFLLS